MTIHRQISTHILYVYIEVMVLLTNLLPRFSIIISNLGFSNLGDTSVAKAYIISLLLILKIVSEKNLSTIKSNAFMVRFSQRVAYSSSLQTV